MPRWRGTSTTYSNRLPGLGPMRAGWAHAGRRPCGSMGAAWRAAEHVLVGLSRRHSLIHTLQHLGCRREKATARVAAAAALDLHHRDRLVREPAEEVGEHAGREEAHRRLRRAGLGFHPIAR